MKVLVTGATGQVGWELQRCVPAGIELDVAGRAGIDLAADDVRERVLARTPELIINAAAYTAVDRAETEPGLAFAVNAAGAGAVAAAAHQHRVRLVHQYTQLVLDRKSNRPY